MSENEKYKLINFDVKGDNRGSLIVFENNTNVPFDIKRVFYIYGAKGEKPRGCHANRKSQFLLIVTNGSCKVKVDDGENKVDFLLDNPNFGLYLDRLVWKEMYDFSNDAVLLVLASEYYTSEEYIRSYDEFLNEIKINND